VKLTLYNRATTSLLERRSITKSVDIQTLIHRNEPNRPHISSVIYQCQRACHPEAKNKTSALKFPSAPACLIFQMPQSILSVSTVSPASPTVSPVRLHCLSSVSAASPPRPSCVSSLPVEGVLVLTPNTRNTKINKITLFCKTNVKIKQKQHLIHRQSQQTCPKIKAKSRQAFTKPEDQTRVTPNIKTYPQTYQQNSTKLIGITLTKTRKPLPPSRSKAAARWRVLHIWPAPPNVVHWRRRSGAASFQQTAGHPAGTYRHDLEWP